MMNDELNPQTPDNEVGNQMKTNIKEVNEHINNLNNEVARLRKLMREYIDFMDQNLGTTADWPMEAAFDDGDVCQRHCDLLNAMKRIVKPEDIN
jgi:polyhydroxyalkanoate synthesis regulator protein